MPQLAPYACHDTASRGRAHDEPECNTRGTFQRDRDRIIHSTAFRRLEYKTQVFVNHEGDHYRNRLTHSLEVSQIARSLSRVLGLNEDLAEALALAHDLGHTPFGHAGEDGLNAAMAEFGGFDHNQHSVRIVTQLEQRYAQFDGLNLTWETLEGLAKHNGPVTETTDTTETSVQLAVCSMDLELSSHASLEAQVASLADDIAYHNHDIDDGLRAGLFSVADLSAVPQVKAVFDEVLVTYPDLPLQRLTHEAVRRLINRMCSDVLAQTKANIEQAEVVTVDDVRAAGKSLVAFSPDMQRMNDDLKSFLMQRMYQHYKVNRMSSKARRVVGELCAFYLAEPDCLPTDWRARAGEPGSAQTAEVVSNYIAGMTDRYALNNYHQIFEVEWFK